MITYGEENSVGVSSKGKKHLYVLMAVFFLWVLFSVYAQYAEAGNWVRVVRGHQPLSIGWSITGGYFTSPFCTPTTDITGGLRDAWMNNGNLGIFGSIPLPPPEVTGGWYTFACSHPSGASDASYLYIDDCPGGQVWNGTACVANTPPVLNSITISPMAAVANGSDVHTISMTMTEESGVTNLSHAYALINYQGANGGQHRGYLTWYAYANAWPGHKDNQACNVGYAAIQPGYGDTNIRLVSCAVNYNSATEIRVDFNVRFERSFVSPTTNNDISGYIQDAGGLTPLYGGGPGDWWKNFDINFWLEPGAVVNNVTINSTAVVPNNINSYAISVSASDNNGAGNVIWEGALINYLGANGGQHRGYLIWGTGDWYAGDRKDFINCNVGYAQIYTGAPGYGNQYLHLDSCSVSDSGPTRTATFNVRFDPLFNTPLTDNDIAGYAYDNYWLGPLAWTNFETNFDLLYPIVSGLTANPNPIAAGAVTTLNWSGNVTANYCYRWRWDGVGWVDSTYVGLNARSSVTPSNPVSTTYLVNCHDGANWDPAWDDMVTVNIAPNPTAWITPTPASIPFDGVSTITWGSSNAVSCTKSWSGGGAVPLSGSFVTPPLQSNMTFWINCLNSVGVSTGNIQTTVVVGPPANCPPQISGTCSLPLITHNTTGAGSCISGYLGTCSATCWNGGYSAQTNLCNPIPDLDPDSPIISSFPVYQGTTVSISGLLRNTGPGATGATSHRIGGFYIDNNGNPATVEHTVGNNPTVSGGSIPSLGTRNVSENWSIPVGEPTGAHLLWYWADLDNSITESDETNNWSGYTGFIVIPQPDLRTVNNPLGAIPNNPPSVTFQGVVFNDGGVTRPGDPIFADVEIDFNNTNCPTAVDELPALVGSTGGAAYNLNQGNSITRTATIGAGYLRNGTHCFRFVADRGNLVWEGGDADETDNASPWQIFSISGLPDSNADLTVNTPAYTVEVDSSITFTGILTNSGTQATPVFPNQPVRGDVEIDWGQGGNCGVATPEDWYIAGGPWHDLAPAASQNLSANIGPGSLVAGSHCYRLIADRSNNVTEVNDNNNATGWFSFNVGGGPGTQCSDNADNDLDTDTDEFDPGCHFDGDPTDDPDDPACATGTNCSYDPSDDNESDPPQGMLRIDGNNVSSIVVAENSNHTFSWTSSGATNCKVSTIPGGDIAGWTGLMGSQAKLVSQAAIYVLQCINAAYPTYSGVDSIDVSLVTPPVGGGTVSLIADKKFARLDEPVELSWNVTTNDTSFCRITSSAGFDSGPLGSGVGVNAVGSIVRNVTGTVTYTLQCASDATYTTILDDQSVNVELIPGIWEG